jgi:transcription-repair coupling factor (superfamily II helicase)
MKRARPAARLSQPLEKQDVKPAPVGAVATRLADAIAGNAALFIAIDEQRALAVAGALRAASPDALIVHVPSSDALPGDRAPPSPANAGRRATALHLLRQRDCKRPVCLVTTVEAAIRLYPSPASFDVAPPRLQVGDAIDATELSDALTEIGYVHDDRVDEPGEMALRGEVIDLFPADAEAPCRIELGESRIVAIRTFDPVTQLSTDAREFLDIGRVAEPPVERDGSNLFEHLADARVFLDPNLDGRRGRFLALIADVRDSTMQAEGTVLDDKRWERAIQHAQTIFASEADDIPRFAEKTAPLRAFSTWVRRHLKEDGRLLIVGGARDLRFLRRRLAKVLASDIQAVAGWREAQTSDNPVMMLEMPVDRGWRVNELAVVSAADLLGSRALLENHGNVIGFPSLDAGAIEIGDVIVHEDFGIGVVAGLEALPADTGSEAGDAIILDYADGGRRLVPVAEADRIWRYGADRDAVSLDKLDGSSWLKRRGAIDEAIAQSARELSRLAVERAGRAAVVIDPPADAYERFAAGFAYSETPDQARAIQAVRTDLASGHPMDRLVIGDVGYGKTEVALRAAALTVLAGKQVAIVAPTTVLVRQHLDLFSKRLALIDAKVAGLSRLSSSAEKAATKKGLADGSTAVVIGTAAVAGKGVSFKDLGLIVIDEEQRFGAADKAKLHKLGADHVLTLSATPIPRTLQSALVGLQQMSVIATPPARRQPVRTSVAPFDNSVVRTALMREQGRGGQSFVVVSRIEDMEPMAARLARLVPELQILTAHGKLAAAEIDDVMVRFAAGEGDVLLATNIIEAGLDVPRANTMIVWRADRFGLSQLHQLRGRVGRGGRRGQLLLTTATDAVISDATQKRLRTLQTLDTLGAGFAISGRDLDMRGAGDLLGDAQAGHMKLIGIDLYQHLLEAGLRRARGETVDRWTPVLNLAIAGVLPESWIPDTSVRLALYARLARITSSTELDAFEAELEDRFGSIPPEGATLLRIAGLRRAARDLDIRRIDAGPGAIALTFGGTAEPLIDGTGLSEKNGRYLLAEAIADPAGRLDRTEQLVETMLALENG